MAIQTFFKDWESNGNEMALAPSLRKPVVGVKVTAAGTDLPEWFGGLTGGGSRELHVKY